MDDFSSEVNETRIKVLSSHPSGHVEVRCPRGKKKNTSVIKNIALMLLQKRFINFKMIIRALGCLNLTGGCHFSNLRHVCGDSFHALQSLGVSGVEMKIYERSLQSPFLGPSLVRSCEARPNRRACSQATGRVTR